jgi:hypothetical protein
MLLTTYSYKNKLKKVLIFFKKLKKKIIYKKIKNKIIKKKKVYSQNATFVTFLSKYCYLSYVTFFKKLIKMLHFIIKN